MSRLTVDIHYLDAPTIVHALPPKPRNTPRLATKKPISTIVTAHKPGARPVGGAAKAPPTPAAQASAHSFMQRALKPPAPGNEHPSQARPKNWT